jgi:hypothetical protein
MFRPKLSEFTVQELHRFAVRENRSLSNMCEIAVRAGLRAMEKMPAPPWAPSADNTSRTHGED